jgi:hypothetical protein
MELLDSHQNLILLPCQPEIKVSLETSSLDARLQNKKHQLQKLLAISVSTILSQAEGYNIS